MIVTDWFSKWADYTPDKVAVSEFETGKNLTYAQLNHMGNRFSDLLTSDYGLKKGDRLAILAENCLEYIILLVVAQKTGIILVPLNYRLTPREIDFLISDSAPELLITEDLFLDKIQQTAAFQKVSRHMDLTGLKVLSESYLANPDKSPYNGIPVSPEDTALIIYTSGTTAFPKGSVYTHGMMFWNSINTQMRLDITSSDRSVNMAPPFHTGNWNVLLTPFLHHGAYTLIMKSFDADKVLEVLEKYDLTIFWAVPTMLKMMADSPAFENADLGKIRYFVVGGEAMPVPLIEKWHAKGVPIRQGYGLTEVGPNVTSLNHGDAIRKAGSIGKPNFYYHTKLVNEAGNEVSSNELGELLLSGPTVTPGYWNNPEATRATIVDGWFHTGDIMRKDEDGFLFVMDRIKNMYISGAENVYPAEIEYLLRNHPAVDAVAIIGVADEKWGESGMAFVVLKPGQKISSEDIISFCEGKLARYKIPKHVRFLGQLPKNDAGKIDRQQLRRISTTNN
ncbi:MAG: long-chain fatty acid--CoA ligase [Lentimicrobium sp.]